MTNLTITVDETVLRRARIRALELGTSVNAVLRAELERFAGNAESHAADLVLQLAAEHTGARPEGSTWTREDLHLERLTEP